MKLNEDIKEKLKVLAGVNEEDIIQTERGFYFMFENSLKANYCRVIDYHDKIIVELRKKVETINGNVDLLVAEDVIKPQEFKDFFQNKTGIYIDYLGL